MSDEQVEIDAEFPCMCGCSVLHVNCDGEDLSISIEETQHESFWPRLINALYMAFSNKKLTSEVVLSLRDVIALWHKVGDSTVLLVERASKELIVLAIRDNEELGRPQ